MTLHCSCFVIKGFTRAYYLSLSLLMQLVVFNFDILPQNYLRRESVIQIIFFNFNINTQTCIYHVDEQTSSKK